MNIENLTQHFGDKFISEVSLKNFSWFKIGGIAKYLFTPHSIEDLTFFLQNKPLNLKIYTIGAGSNLLIPDKFLDYCIIKLNYLNTINIVDNDFIECEAGAMNSSLCAFALNHNYGGFEFSSGIPGSVGGGVAMNAGAFDSEFAKIVNKVYALDYQGNKLEFNNIDMGFAYRKNSLSFPVVFYKVIFKTFKSTTNEITAKLNNIKLLREANQPKKVLTGGSTFANPLPHKAWELIDKVGLRGYRIGGAKYSEKHCNFIINDNNACYDDIKNLIIEAKNKVKAQFNIDLHTEIKILEEII